MSAIVLILELKFDEMQYVYVMPDFKFWNTPIQLYCGI